MAKKDTIEKNEMRKGHSVFWVGGKVANLNRMFEEGSNKVNFEQRCENGEVYGSRIYPLEETAIAVILRRK